MSEQEGPGERRSGLSGIRMTRVKLLKTGAAGVAGAAAGGALLGEAQAKETVSSAPLALRFLTPWEFEYVTAMAETIWPTDELGPGARVAASTTTSTASSRAAGGRGTGST
jgi:hypothetical protein